MKQTHRTVLLWIFLIVVFVAIYHTLRTSSAQQAMSFTDFIHKALPKDGDTEVSRIKVKDHEIEGRLKDGTRFRTYGDISDYQRELIDRGIEVQYEPQEEGTFWLSLLGTWVPMLFLFFLFFLFMRQLQSGSGKAMSFGKSRHKLLNDGHQRVTFDDIAGIEEAKEELQEIVEFLKNPRRFTRLGGRIPKGVLLMGPPGTGKTLLAKGVAGEAGVPFFSISGSDFVEMFVGVGASRVRDLFEQGKKHAPCIIFIDEIDAVGRHRGAGLGGGHDEREQTLNQLLVEMDGFDSSDGVILIAATNRPDVLDPALLRPGRFDRRVVVQPPDMRGRYEILRVHTRKVPLADDVDLETIARGTPGFSGADLANLVNEAALAAARRDADRVWMEDFENAKDRVLMGVARRSLVMSDEEKRTTAWHESGHALVARLLPNTDPVHKVTIIPRGRAMGLTQQVPMEDRYSYDAEYVFHRICVLMGGRVAEELTFGKRTTGAGNDIEQATQLARKMVCEWGMSSLGTIALGHPHENVFLGRDLTRAPDYSEATASRIDREIKRIVNQAYDRARELLTEHRDTLDALANALLEFETLDSTEIDIILEGGSVDDIRRARSEVASKRKAAADAVRQEDASAARAKDRADLARPGHDASTLPEPA